MEMLDLYTPKLLSLFQAKKGAVGARIQAQMSVLLQVLKIILHLFNYTLPAIIIVPLVSFTFLSVKLITISNYILISKSDNLPLSSLILPPIHYSSYPPVFLNPCITF